MRVDSMNAGLMGGMVAAMLLWGAWSGQAQSVTLTGPVTNVVVEDGDDFATDALGHQWNMDRIRDLALDLGFSQPTVPGGIWQAQALSTLAFYEPLFTGYNDLTYLMYFSRYDEGTPYGPLNPIEADKYTRLSMRTSLPSSARSSIIGTFTKDYRQFGSDGFSLQDTQPAVQGFRMYDVDLTGDDWLQEKVPGMAPWLSVSGAPWRDLVYGFALRPTASIPIGTMHKVDWIRLYDPTTSPQLTITWNSSGVPNDSTHAMNLYVDTDTNGVDGDLLVSGIANDGDYTLNTAALPPGAYYFYLKAAHATGGGQQEEATSGYSARLDIRAPPMVTIQAPSFTSGEDYATTVVGNAWDMNSSADIASFYDVAFPGFSNGQLTGLAGKTDPQMNLNMKVSGVLKPIDPKKYRYLSFRMNADMAGTLNFGDRIATGWVARFFWWNAAVGTDGSVSKDIPILEGWHRYIIDMWDTSFVESVYTGLPQRGWKSLSQVNGLRFDPLEVFKSTWFNIDEFKLCAENKPKSGSYTIKWTLADADSPTMNLKVYQGYESGGGYVEIPTPLVQRNAAVPGPDSFVWSMSQVPDGRYFLRFEADDGVNTRSTLTEVPLIVDNGFPRMDVEGMDPTIFNRTDRTWKTLHADGSGYTQVTWGQKNSDPVAADYDGDGRMDRAVFKSKRGRWSIQQSSNGLQMGGGQITWGAGGKPVPADYDGDGRADLAVFVASTGAWTIRKSSDGLMFGGAPIIWGVGGVPAPADFDGDGKADLAVYTAASSAWTIRKSSDGLMFGGAPIVVGTANGTPVPADYDGDGLADLAAYAPGASRWYVRQSSTGTLMGGGSVLWGAAGNLPVPGDFDDDGKVDLAVYNPNDGYWSFLFSGGGSTSGGPWGGGGGNNNVPIAGEFVP